MERINTETGMLSQTWAHKYSFLDLAEWNRAVKFIYTVNTKG
jgi:hypothetical protein